MSEVDVMIVLVLRDAGLRSILAARLSFAGAQVVTAQAIHDPAVTRHIRKRAVLVVEAEAVAGRSGEWIDALVDDPLWIEVVVLVEEGERECLPDEPRLLPVHRIRAYPELYARLPYWTDAAR
ncbi:hypothetical protein ACFQ1E_05630 [Sphingomonas canadensis]|uniref:Uncharacterized protein n=1 Tax=Sphingomonas canadensis TaxID=1219257 RepID=A0ABW3H4N6_9SPHN|nr:hypothetical protein [Sphingomonas canadensis]MCW3835731.1 hypothetical protein [Sphingomonas canadensis]